MNNGKMSKRMKDHYCYLEVISKAHPKVCKKIIQSGSKELIKCFCELSANTINGNVKLSKKDQKSLKPYAKHIRYLAGRKDSIAKKKKFLTQRGGFLPLLIGPALGLLASLIVDIVT